MRTGWQISRHLSGRAVPKMLDFSQFHEVLGEELPNITPDRVGKFRLQQVLRRRFGPGYKNHPVGQAAMRHFNISAKVE